jgi:hypothetical protein
VVLSILAGIASDRLVIATAAHAQEAARINIGGESVFIGMPKDAALAEFAGKYSIRNLDGSRVLIGQETESEKRHGALGILTFDNGRLKSAKRYWCDLLGGHDDIEPLWNALHGVLAQGTRTTIAEIKTFSTRLPDSQEDLI